MSICKVIIGSATQAMKASRLLNSFSIPAVNIKVSSSKVGNGCSFGIEFDCMHLNNVKQILAKEKISFEEYKNDLFR